MPLTVTRRKDNRGALTISGRIHYPDGTSERIRRTAQSHDIQLAREEAAALEAEKLRTAWHGERRGARAFGEVLKSYLAAVSRPNAEKYRLERIRQALGDSVPLSAIDQETINTLRQTMFTREPSDATVIRSVITPLRAVLRYAHRRKWCDAPSFEIPKQPKGRTKFLMPNDVRRLVLAAAPHIKPLIVFYVGTGARLSEAIEMEWRDVDLIGRRATLWIKGRPRRRRIVDLPPAVVDALMAIATQQFGTAAPEGRVFKWQTATPSLPGKTPKVSDYASRNRERGGYIQTAWKSAIRRAGLDPELTPHDLRHTWASWHYALHKDLLLLKRDGMWGSVTLVERYAHLLPEGHEAEIRTFLAAGHKVVTSAAEKLASD